MRACLASLILLSDLHTYMYVCACKYTFGQQRAMERGQTWHSDGWHRFNLVTQWTAAIGSALKTEAEEADRDGKGGEIDGRSR